MQLDRRSFLRVATATTVSGFVHLKLTGVALAQAPAPTGTGLTMASFMPHVNSAFRFAIGGASVTMVLTRVTDERKPGTKGECFSLLFSGPAPAARQGTYTVDHAALGRFSLFVVPVGRRTGGQDYQAVFNRLTR